MIQCCPTVVLIILIERLRDQYRALDAQIAEIERDLAAQLRDDETGQRLQRVPGIGPVTASLLAAELGDGNECGSARGFAASLGLVPSKHSTTGRAQQMGISKRGDKNLRLLLAQCARVYMQNVNRQTGRLADWVRELSQRRHSNVVACAVANKFARILWAMTTRRVDFERAGEALQD